MLTRARSGRALLLMLVAAVVLAACAAPGASPTPYAGPLYRMAPVSAVEVQVATAPLSAVAVVRGNFPDTCTSLENVLQDYAAGHFDVTLVTMRPNGKPCATQLVPFTHTVTLGVAGLPAGDYEVAVNGVTAAFALPAVEQAAAAPEPTPAPTEAAALDPNQPTPQPTESGVHIAPNALATSVKYVLALAEVAVFAGEPGDTRAQVRTVPAGETLLVTGISADEAWWRVLCQGNVVGNCWASTNERLTAPHTLNPGTEIEPGVLETGVRYVMAMAPVPVYAIAAAEGEPMRELAAGETTLVTGVSQDLQWWRVLCPGDVVGNCWATADPRHTQPAVPPGFFGALLAPAGYSYLWY